MKLGEEMYVIKADMKILVSDELQSMLDQYEEKFGERVIAFNYADFHGVRGAAGSAAQEYKEALEAALKKDTPTCIESHRYDIFDH